MPPVTQKADLANHRTVVMLRHSERSKLEMLAASEAVSAAEIVRREIDAYDPTDDEEEELLFAMESMRCNLKEAIQSVRHVRVEVAATRAQTDEAGHHGDQ